MSPENAPHHGSRSSFIEQEFVIGGYTEPEGARKHFGALLIGVYEEKKLKFAGRVGTGFNDKLLRSLSADFDKIRVENCTFFNVPAKGRSQWDLGLTAAGRASSPVARSINSGCRIPQRLATVVSPRAI